MCEKLQTCNVFLDTQVFVAETIFVGTKKLATLSKLAAEGKINLLISAVTVAECRSQIEKLVAEAGLVLSGNKRELAILRNATSLDSSCLAQLDKLPLLKKISWLLTVLCALINLTGCVTAPNGFRRFYRDLAGEGITNLAPYSGTTKIFMPSNPTNDFNNLMRNGYVLIGESSFQGPPQSNGALMSQAKKVGADVVLVSSAYLGSQQTAVPWIQYNPGQTYTTTTSGTVNANAWGSGGYAYGTGNYYGNSTTTTPGTFSTQIIPVTVQLYSYDAGFFRKRPAPIFGALSLPLPSEIRTQLERNTGVLVSIVVNDSPAFNANILEGDVILKMNGEDVMSVPDLLKKNMTFAGQKVDVEIWRNGQFKTISVQLNNKP